MLHKARSIAVCYWVDLESELLAIFGGHEVLMANGQRELLVGIEISKLVGIGVGGSDCGRSGFYRRCVRGRKDEQACSGLVSSRRDTGSTFRHCQQAFRILSALRALSALHDS